ncbi:MAG TPA: phytanoyl-CoA dioxygenase family protein [Bryobacteraceae bacterium]
MIFEQTRTSEVLDRLERDGLAVLPDFVQGETLGAMQRAFNSRLERMRWNNFDGYERTERYRLNVQDILTLEQGFVSTAIHPVVKDVLRAYLGDSYQLVEAKGWRSVATRRVFHGWHGDSWYDKTKVSGIPREVKLGLYLTDVKTGAFRYLRGSHRQHQTRDWKNHEIEKFNQDDISVVTGTAGTAFLFDTSGIHGQSWPILEPRHAVFYNYHDPSIPLQEEDISGGRYHPLMLNAAFLGGLTAEDQFILGFGNQTHFHPEFRKKPRHEGFQWWQDSLLKKKIVADETAQRIAARLRRMIR